MFGMNSKGAAAQINPEGLRQLNRGHMEEPIDYVLLQIKINTHYSVSYQLQTMELASGICIPSHSPVHASL